MSLLMRMSADWDIERLLGGLGVVVLGEGLEGEPIVWMSLMEDSRWGQHVNILILYMRELLNGQGVHPREYIVG